MRGLKLVNIREQPAAQCAQGRAIRPAYEGIETRFFTYAHGCINAVRREIRPAYEGIETQRLAIDCLARSHEVARSAPPMRGLKRGDSCICIRCQTIGVARSAPPMRGLKHHHRHYLDLLYPFSCRAIRPAYEGIET